MDKLIIAFRDVVDGPNTRDLICETHIFQTPSLLACIRYWLLY